MMQLWRTLFDIRPRRWSWHSGRTPRVGAGLLAIACIAACAASWAASAQTTHATPLRPSIRHVFVLVLENESADTTFGATSRAPYLAHTLRAAGVLLRSYYGIGHLSLDNYIAMISGQAPNDSTQLDCHTFAEFQLVQPFLDTHGQALGKGCVYPRKVRTIVDQLESQGLRWKAYMEDMGNDPQRESATCGHPRVGAIDGTQRAEAGDQYATRHDPFMYFHSIIDNQARCDAHVVNLRRLSTDLATIATTPNYVFITPNLCSDGHDLRCADSSAGGLPRADRFVRHWVPLITASPAFKRDGVLIVTFDESGQSPVYAAACCGEQGLPGQNHPPGLDGPGGGPIGAIILSPFSKAGTESTQPYNHYSMLRSIEDIFGLPHLGYAAESGLAAFGPDVFAATSTGRSPAR